MAKLSAYGRTCVAEAQRETATDKVVMRLMSDGNTLKKTAWKDTMGKWTWSTWHVAHVAQLSPDRWRQHLESHGWEVTK